VAVSGSESPDWATQDLRAWKVAVKRGEARAFQERVLSAADSEAAQVLVLRADLVFGLAHIRSALYHARKAMSEGRNSSEMLSMETLLYASGERQLSSAIKKMSADDNVEEVVVAWLSSGGPRPEKGWRDLEERYSGSDSVSRLRAFGISGSELSTTRQDRVCELVLEKVAAVDVIRK